MSDGLCREKLNEEAERIANSEINRAILNEGHPTRFDSVPEMLISQLRNERDSLQSQLTQAQKHNWNNMVCIHHTDRERAASIGHCPICAENQLTQAKEENAIFRNAQKACEDCDALTYYEVVALKTMLHQSNSLVLELRELVEQSWNDGFDDGRSNEYGRDFAWKSSKAKEQLTKIVIPTSANYIPREEYERLFELLKKLDVGWRIREEVSKALAHATQLLKGKI